MRAGSRWTTTPAVAGDRKSYTPRPSEMSIKKSGVGDGKWPAVHLQGSPRALPNPLRPRTTGLGNCTDGSGDGHGNRPYRRNSGTSSASRGTPVTSERPGGRGKGPPSASRGGCQPHRARDNGPLNILALVDGWSREPAPRKVRRRTSPYPLGFSGPASSNPALFLAPLLWLRRPPTAPFRAAARPKHSTRFGSEGVEPSAPAGSPSWWGIYGNLRRKIPARWAVQRVSLECSGSGRMRRQPLGPRRHRLPRTAPFPFRCPSRFFTRPAAGLPGSATPAYLIAFIARINRPMGTAAFGSATMAARCSGCLRNQSARLSCCWAERYVSRWQHRHPKYLSPGGR
jgi:hypothetical protein